MTPWLRERLVDPRFGLVPRLHDVALPEDFPPMLRHAHAVVADSTTFSPWPSDDRAGGFAFGDREQARAAALGEAVERTCGNLIARPLKRATWKALTASGDDAVDPTRLALFAGAQYDTPGFPFRRFGRDLPVLWTAGRRLDSGAPCQVPASLVWVTFHQGIPARDEPRTHAVPYAGVATGTSRAAAERGALLELAERDAFALAWHRGDALPPIDVPDWLDALIASPEAPRRRLRLFQCPSDLGLPVVAALVEDPERGHPEHGHRALGVACRETPRAAAEKATAEAFQLLTTVRLLDDPRSAYHRSLTAGAPGLGVRGWRADRAYRAEFRSDWRDAWDLLCHLQIHLDPSSAESLADRLASGLDPAWPMRRIDQLPRLLTDDTSIEGRRDALVERFVERGYPPIAVDLETPEVAAIGLAVTRVIAPGLYGNAPAAFPYLGGPRFADAVERDAICRLPPPYA